ncbi:MAG: Na+/H+ antiporter subunit E [Proteobacteria bacterium]|nr:Na+/H+ antiporter subunit E [Pseudomonadota bacterium]MBU1743317.1 Na+/H+ antiporter subunit E [Pseudomonadota bacterium]MBU4371834.1 Na+/H+ antiporter subunit E [Pseudomonadota bacterium]MBU4581426.1 Na+/H+ antiporter subunit E [Pseudomonadota bacterium]MCG2741976.1 Na+/H+ antiporter subunit E [Syntrophaceae bacterium]
MNRTFLRNTIIQAVLLMVFWLILSGHYDLMHVSFGIFSVILVLLINHPLRRRLFALEEERSATLNLSRLLRLSFYIPWLLIQIAVSSLQVARVVLHPKCPIDPALLRFKTKLKNVSSRVILANSITLTPGTITLEIKEDEFLVHALMDISSTAIIDGTLPGQVARLYERRPGQVIGDVEIIKTAAGL